MLYGINASVDYSQQKQYEVRAELMKLGKKYRKIDHVVKSGLIDMEKNFLYYLNCGADSDELKFYLEHHDRENREMLDRFSNADSIFNKKLRGRSIVLSVISDVLNGQD